jgi:hypothetical protein
MEDSIASMVGEIYDGIVRLQRQTEETEAACKKMQADFLAQMKDEEGRQDEAEVQLALEVKTKNENEGMSELKNKENTDLQASLAGKMNECSENKAKIAATMCGLKTVRMELYTMAGEKPWIQDCQVGEWEIGECSATCGGGERILSRPVVADSSGGAQCPPLQSREGCNDFPCPQDCVLDEWSEWSGCSKDCGGGIKARSRVQEVEAKNGGTCDKTEEAVSCNDGACDADCNLGFWTEWSDCSRACGGGVVVRTVPVVHDPKGMGKCPDPTDKVRFSTMECNPDPCPDEIECQSKMDVVFVVDASGSVSLDDERATLARIVSHLRLGDDDAHVGVVEYGTRARIVAPLAAEPPADVSAGVGHATKLSEGLLLALNALQSGGREEATAVVVVLTDGAPNSHEDAAFVSAKVRETARLVFIPSGISHWDLLTAWASVPADQNMVLASAATSDLVSMLCPAVACVGTLTDDAMVNNTIVAGNRTACDRL